MPRKKKVELILTESSKRELEVLKQYEPYFDLKLFKIRIVGLLGMRNLREQMMDANDEQWTLLYDMYKGDK